MEPRLVTRLRRDLGADRLVTDPDVLRAHEREATGRFGGQASALVRPRSAREVASVVGACREHRTGLVTQGGNTGLVGGSVPRGGEILLSTAQLTAGPTVDTMTGQITAGAGVSLGSVQRAAADAGWRYPVDFAARETASIGGTVATNAGGHYVLAHGMTRRRLIGVEAVLGTGAVVRHVSGMVKDNTGFDLASLLCGSEGTLGVVTLVRLALVPPPREVTVALVGVDGLGPATELVAEARRLLPDLEAAEVVLAEGAELVRAAFDRRPLFDPEPPVTVLLEVAGAVGVADRVADFLAEAAPDRPSALATDRPGRDELWRIREEHSAAVATLGSVHKYDVTLPPDRLPEIVDAVRARVRCLAGDPHVWVFGHIGDGNLHLNVTGLGPEDAEVDAAVLPLVAEAGGSISAEHGIGVAKRAWLPLARSPEEIDAFRAIKAALDPDGILNPGVLV